MSRSEPLGPKALFISQLIKDQLMESAFDADEHGNRTYTDQGLMRLTLVLLKELEIDGHFTIHRFVRFRHITNENLSFIPLQVVSGNAWVAPMISGANAQATVSSIELQHGEVVHCGSTAKMSLSPTVDIIVVSKRKG